LKVEKEGADFAVRVMLYHEDWLVLPGNKEAWPINVKMDGVAHPVTETGGVPRVLLPAGEHQLSGQIRWAEIPASLVVSRQYGVVSLSVEGRTVELPSWDGEDKIWIKPKAGAEEMGDQKNSLTLQVYRLLEDGIPMWLRTELEVTVSGKSREEELGALLPEGWKLAAVHAPIPVAVDESGRVKMQVRAGRWIVQLDAFRTEPLKTFQFASGARPPVDQELVAFRSLPEMRVVELRGVPSVDVTQTTFPKKWHDCPVYLWKTEAPFQLEEKMRGMGMQRPEGLRVRREMWLDEEGKGLTYRDKVTGTMQQLWRLDASESYKLGTVKINGTPQLVTKNPRNGLSGVEVRSRNLSLEAVGRSEKTKSLQVVGWETGVDAMELVLNMPPGWRVLAVLGGDKVRGDWITAWTLLDLFLVLIAGLTVFRVWGVLPGLVAFLGMALAYHEPEAPRVAWLVLLGVVVLVRVVPEGFFRRSLTVVKWGCAAVLLYGLLPFLAGQMQGILHPQLERGSVMSDDWPDRADAMEEPLAAAFASESEARVAPAAPAPLPPRPPARMREMRRAGGTSSVSKMRQSSDEYYSSPNANLLQEPKAKIQTGPGVPEWHWRSLVCSWDGPVSSKQEIRPLWISPFWQRALALVRVLLLVGFLGILLEARNYCQRSRSGGGAGVPSAVPLGLWLVLGLCFFATTSSAFGQSKGDIPDEATLGTLRARLIEPHKAFPAAADISNLIVQVNGQKLTMEAEVHAVIQTAVPMPGGLPEWSPVAVTMDGTKAAVVRRWEGRLWVVVPAGVHKVRVESRLPMISEWSLSFLARPRYVAVEAPEWQVSGVRPGGIPENQLFFAQKQKAAPSVQEAAYDRNDYRTVVTLDRSIELGLVWRLQNTVRRLSPSGKAISLQIPLIEGEQVVSSHVMVEGGFVQVRLGAQEEQIVWESELAIVPKIQLAAAKTEQWVEHWRLISSPVWNVTLTGLDPIFEQGQEDVVPVWHPWPGEGVVLAVDRPEEVPGAVQTVHRVSHELRLGKSYRHSVLRMNIQSSLGEDFPVTVGGASAEVSGLKLAGQPVPVRMEGEKVIIPLRPGQQEVELEWKTPEPLTTWLRADRVGMPVEAANVTTTFSVPEDRWVLWAAGPLRGPAVRFWGLLVCALGAGWLLARVPGSPLSATSWMLLCVGLTQAPVEAALVVAGWFFMMVGRGKEPKSELRWWLFDLRQLFLAGWSIALLAYLLEVVRQGLLGIPEMRISGNGSSLGHLVWYQPLAKEALPTPQMVSVSIWFYRLLMLLWALWLAHSLIEWLRWGWTQYSRGGLWKVQERIKPSPLPPVVPRETAKD
jgi:hypothetical protein